MAEQEIEKTKEILRSFDYGLLGEDIEKFRGFYKEITSRDNHLRLEGMPFEYFLDEISTNIQNHLIKIGGYLDEENRVSLIFKKYIRNETHYELRRKELKEKKIKWNNDRKRFIGLTHEAYEKTRDRVLKSFVGNALLEIVATELGLAKKSTNKFMISLEGCIVN